jgi:hypothetical protein
MLTWREIARWVSVVPAAGLTALAAQFPIHWILLLNYYFATERDEDGHEIVAFPLALISIDVLEGFVVAFSMPFIIISVGTLIAPRRKLETGIVMSLLVLAFIGYASTQIVSDVSEGLYTGGRWLRLAVTVALWALGIVLGLYSAYRQSKGQTAALDTPLP